MAQYEVSQTYFFRETGEKVEAGSTVELPEDVADSLNGAHPGLLKPTRRTTVGSPQKTVRGGSDDETATSETKRKTTSGRGRRKTR